MMTKSLLAAGFMLLSAADAFATCSIPPIRTLGNQTVPGTMYASSGKPCSLSLLGIGGQIRNTELVQKAASGSVVVVGNRVTYTSRPGFVGDDHFTYARHGLSGSNVPMVWTVDMVVHVAK